jgi:hypothetical protein
MAADGGQWGETTTRVRAVGLAFIGEAFPGDVAVTPEMLP